MRTRVTAIPEDNLVNIDGQVLFFPYTAPYDVRVLQWRGSSGQLEFVDVSRNTLFGPEHYDEYVAPFVALWEAEKARHEEEASRLPTLEEARAARLAEVMSGYDAALAPIETVYPAKERETWTIQLEEARAVMADPQAETPMLSTMVAARGRGESVADFAQVVMANNAAYRLLAGALLGQQQRMYAELNALQTVEEIQTYQVSYTMPEGLHYVGT